MELHPDDGTQRLELPVSRTTLNSCGGVPRVISEKSRGNQNISFSARNDIRCRYKLTLSIQEVINEHVMALISMERGVSE